MDEERQSVDWESVFGHPEPYDHQRDAITDVLETARHGGYTLIEGACGTGKTMIALTAAATLVADPTTRFEQVFVLTSVKQQLTQFEADLRQINRSLPAELSPLDGVSLVGKTDVCPFARTTTAGITPATVGGRCNELRGKTAALTDGEFSAHELATHAREFADAQPETWTVDGTAAPYSAAIPSDGDDEYCPFYAGFLAGEDVSPEDAPGNVLSAAAAVETGVDRGTCPHSALSSSVADADIVLANYYHAFDSDSLRLTHDLLSEETILICDEAHTLPGQVRDILSQTVRRETLLAAQAECARVLAGVAPDAVPSPRRVPVDADIARAALAEVGYDGEALLALYEALGTVRRGLDAIVESQLDQRAPDGWQRRPTTVSETTIPLRQPADHTPDTLSTWLARSDVDETVWPAAPELASAATDALEATVGPGQWALPDVASTLADWDARDHERYFRDVHVTSPDSPSSGGTATGGGGPGGPGSGGGSGGSPGSGSGTDWAETLSISLRLHNCLPRAVISSRLDDFGAGVLMSATLEPVDVFRDVTGLSYLADVENVRVISRRYGSSFPPDNRLSGAVTLPAFTASNRGDPPLRVAQAGAGEVDPTTVERVDGAGLSRDQRAVREQYATALRAFVAAVDGTVLVATPSYREAAWAAAVLARSDATPRVFLDQSSSAEATTHLRERFVACDQAALVTGLRGTLTEGVDYDGDKLAGCLVVGVPVANIGTPRQQAMIAAYRERYGHQRGFEYAMTVPAVRKARQALGRVIRGDEDVGVRLLLDERYCQDGSDASGTDGGVRQYLSPAEQREYITYESVDAARRAVASFWP